MLSFIGNQSQPKRYEFFPILADSSLWFALGCDEYAKRGCTVWVCEASPCPTCSSRAIYYIGIATEIDLRDPDAANLLTIVQRKAKSNEYHCSKCGTRWGSLDGFWQAYREFQAGK